MRSKQPPALSRKVLVPIVAACLLVSALAIPIAAHLPKWIEAELVLGTWWIVWWSVIAWLLYRGHRMDDDVSRPESTEGWLANVWNLFDGGFTGAAWIGEGLLSCLGVLVLGLVAILVVALIMELLVPLIAFILLASIGGMLARAVNDDHRCEDNLLRSIVWGFLWSTLYTGPIAVIVLWIGVLVQSRS